MQYDSWWYYKGSHSGVNLWEPMPFTLGGHDVNGAPDTWFRFNDTMNTTTVNHTTVHENTVGSENTVSKNTANDNTVTGNTVKGNTVSGNTVKGNTVNGKTVNGKTSNNPMVSHTVTHSRFFESDNAYILGTAPGLPPHWETWKW